MNHLDRSNLISLSKRVKERKREGEREKCFQLKVYTKTFTHNVHEHSVGTQSLESMSSPSPLHCMLVDMFNKSKIINHQGVHIHAKLHRKHLTYHIRQSKCLRV